MTITQRDLRESNLAAVAAESMGICDAPQPETWETRYLRLMLRASHILDHVDAAHASGRLTGEDPIDEADRLIQEAKALRAGNLR